MIHAWCLMSNHYHLVLETPRGGLARAMSYLNGVYAQSFNRRHDSVGHVLQGRYKAILIQRDAHLLELARYVVLNPVRASLCRHPEEFRWSSYRATAGLERPPPFLDTSTLLAHFGVDPASAPARYRAFVAAGTEASDPLIEPRGVVLGDDDFLAHATGSAERSPEIPRRQRSADRPPLKALLEEGEHAVVKAYREHGYTLGEIARELGCHYSTVSRRLRLLEEGLDPPPRRRR